MNPPEIFCPNRGVPQEAREEKGTIGVQGQQGQRYICHGCHATFSASKGTIFHGLKTDAVTVLLVVTLLAYGCPVPAIVKAFGFDERTVKTGGCAQGSSVRRP